MPVKLFWTPKARADVKCIYIEMRKGQPRSAERYFATIRRKAELLIEHPRLGERHPVGSALAGLFRGSELATLF